MKTLAQISAQLEAKRQAIASFAAKYKVDGAWLDTTPVEEFKTLNTEVATLTEEMKTVQAMEDSLASNAEELKKIQDSLTEYKHAGQHSNVQQPGGTPATKTLTLPAEAKRYRGQAFLKESGSFMVPDPEQAYKFGRWLLAVLTKSQKHIQFCKDWGFPVEYAEAKVGVESVNSSGGALVPIQFDNDLIVLREKYGVFRPNAKLSRMSTDTKLVPRRTSGVTAYYVGEDASITDSTKGWDNVRLVAKKLAALVKYSNELNEDAVIDIGNDLAEEIAYAFAKAEDDAGFNGDGSSTYGGIVGVIKSFTNLSGTIANIAGLQVATGTGYATSYGSIVLSDLNAVKAKLPKYARDNAKWYCNQAFFDGVMEKLLVAAGGVTVAQIQMGAGQGRYGDYPTFLGFPVVTSQIFALNPAVNQVALLFGDLSKAALFGDRRETTIAMSEHAGFAQDELQIRGTERYDIAVHDVGNASATASLRVPGPIVGLITAAS